MYLNNLFWNFFNINKSKCFLNKPFKNLLFLAAKTKNEMTWKHWETKVTWNIFMFYFITIFNLKKTLIDVLLLISSKPATFKLMQLWQEVLQTETISLFDVPIISSLRHFFLAVLLLSHLTYNNKFLKDLFYHSKPPVMKRPFRDKNIA